MPMVLQTTAGKSNQKLDPYLGIEPSINGFADRAVTQPGHTGKILAAGLEPASHPERSNNWRGFSV